MKTSDVFEQVYGLVKQVPRGRVATYGDIASILYLNPRYIGYVLHHNPYPGEVPCHRIVNCRGLVAATFAFGGGDAQQKLLEAEGVKFANHRIDLVEYRFRF